MNVTCEECGSAYDDARCSTLCPHEAFLTEQQAARKDRAMAMLGKDLQFTNGAPSPTPIRILAVHGDGFVTLRDFPFHHRYNPDGLKETGA